jgi:hypothetical protein
MRPDCRTGCADREHFHDGHVLTGARSQDRRPTGDVLEPVGLSGG